MASESMKNAFMGIILFKHKPLRTMECYGKSFSSPNHSTYARSRYLDNLQLPQSDYSSKYIDQKK